jgi:Transposase IS116/IS110/IS902 family
MTQEVLEPPGPVSASPMCAQRPRAVPSARTSGDRRHTKRPESGCEQGQWLVGARYLVCLLMAPSSQGLEPPTKPGRFKASAWTQAHERWLAAQRFEERGLVIAYGEAVAAVASVRAPRGPRPGDLRGGGHGALGGVVGRLSCLRGVSTLSAFGLAAEIGDWQRFDGRSIGAYLGLVPSESSTGERARPDRAWSMRDPAMSSPTGHARS